MFTRCPACHTLFRITADTLRAARGQVRCGRCQTRFDALEHLMEGAVAAPAAEASGPGASLADRLQEARSAPAGEEPRAVAERAEAGMDAAADTGGAPPAGGPDVAPETEPETEARTEPEPEPGTQQGARPEAVTLGLDREVVEAALLGETPERRGAARRIAASLAVLALLAVLGLQWAYMQRVPLYERQPALRPWLQRMCDVLHCALPLPRAPERIEVVTRQVREHPRVAGALLVDLTFVSRAGEPVAYPVLELQLSDLSGNRIAGRRFAPREYLPAGTDRSKGLRPDVPQHVTLELVEPDAQIMSFQFEFR